jgi:hypothetical protein
MILQIAQAIATEQPKRTTGQRFAAVLANACEPLSSAKEILRPLVLSGWICLVKQVHSL